MYLEHVNITVPNPRGIANALCRLFGWHVRWEGEAKDNGYSVHVGDDKSYLALYEPACELEPEPARYTYMWRDSIMLAWLLMILIRSMTGWRRRATRPTDMQIMILAGDSILLDPRASNLRLRSMTDPPMQFMRAFCEKPS